MMAPVSWGSRSDEDRSWLTSSTISLLAFREARTTARYPQTDPPCPQLMPHLKRLPSEYIHDHVWLTTQPMEEPANRAHVLDAIDWIGWDRLLFATDYPHWDYDDPAHVLPMPVSEQKKRDFFLNNALALYGQG